MRRRVAAARDLARRTNGREVGPALRAQHGAWRDEVERAPAPVPPGVRYSTEPGREVARRRRYGAALDRLSLPDELRRVAEEMAALAAAAERLGNLRGCLAEARRGDPDADPDAARRRVVMAAARWRRVVAALPDERVMLGGALVSERELVLRVVIAGAPLTRCHGGERKLAGACWRRGKVMLAAGLARVAELL